MTVREIGSGQQLRELLADNLRELIDLDPRDEAEIMRATWPGADLRTAQKRLRRLVPKSKRSPGPGSWPRAEAWAALAEVLGVQPYELLLPPRLSGAVALRRRAHVEKKT